MMLSPFPVASAFLALEDLLEACPVVGICDQVLFVTSLVKIPGTGPSVSPVTYSAGQAPVNAADLYQSAGLALAFVLDLSQPHWCPGEPGQSWC